MYNIEEGQVSHLRECDLIKSKWNKEMNIYWKQSFKFLKEYKILKFKVQCLLIVGL